MNRTLKRKNRQTYYGALDLTQPNLIVRKYDQGNGEATVDFLKELIRLNPDPKIHIFWDGVSDHRGEKMREFLESINQGLQPENWKITGHLFAPYAPEENPIEAVWLSLKNLTRRCYRFCKNFKVMTQLFEFLVKLKLLTFPKLENYDAFSCLV